jgi:hypothetical protein
MMVNFRFVSGKIFSLKLDSSQTIGGIKTLIHDQFPDVSVDVVKLIYRASILPDPLPIGEVSISPMEYIVVQPRSFRPKVLPPFEEDLPPPIPAGASSPEEPTGRLLEILSTAPIVPNTPENQRLLQELLDMGFPQEQAEVAIFRSLGNLERATDALLNQNVAPFINPASRHREALIHDRSSLEYILRDIIALVPQNLAELYIEDPSRVLRELDLNPADYNYENLRGKLTPGLPPPPAAVDRPLSRDEQDQQVINRLMEFAGELSRDVVREIYISGGRDEDMAREMLMAMRG